MDGHYYLALCKEVPDPKLSIAEAYVSLGYLPPLWCCSLELDERDIDPRTILACQRTCKLASEQSARQLLALEEYRTNRQLAASAAR